MLSNAFANTREPAARAAVNPSSTILNRRSDVRYAPEKLAAIPLRSQTKPNRRIKMNLIGSPSLYSMALSPLNAFDQETDHPSRTFSTAPLSPINFGWRDSSTNSGML